MNRIGILGGTFDPIHLGHLIPAQYAYEYLHLDRVILVPSASPVHRPRHTPAPGPHRLAMCHLAIGPLPPFCVSELEVARVEPSYTVLTLQHLAKAMPPTTQLVLLVGEDNLPLLHTWHRIDEVVALATLAVLPRPAPSNVDLAPLIRALGSGAVQRMISNRVPGPLVPISATAVRDRVRDGLSIAGLVPGTVARYIAENGLYRSVNQPMTDGWRP